MKKVIKMANERQEQEDKLIREILYKIDLLSNLFEEDYKESEEKNDYKIRKKTDNMVNDLFTTIIKRFERAGYYFDSYLEDAFYSRIYTDLYEYYGHKLLKELNESDQKENDQKVGVVDLMEFYKQLNGLNDTDIKARVEHLEAQVEQMGKEMGRMEWDIAMLKRYMEGVKDGKKK